MLRSSWPLVGGGIWTRTAALVGKVLGQLRGVLCLAVGLCQPVGFRGKDEKSRACWGRILRKPGGEAGEKVQAGAGGGRPGGFSTSQS